MDKRWLVEQLADRLRQSAAVARRESEAAATEAREGATASERKEDARVLLEYGSLAKGQNRRAERALSDLATIESFHPAPVRPSGPVAMGAVVEVEDGEEGRTFFLAPAGAGMELTGPGGDGFLSVVTAASPIGRAVLGRRVGDSFEVVVEGNAREWTITWVG